MYKQQFEVVPESFIAFLRNGQKALPPSSFKRKSKHETQQDIELGHLDSTSAMVQIKELYPSTITYMFLEYHFYVHDFPSFIISLVNSLFRVKLAP